ncbi:Crp/Fnr family transcriptional regulator [Gracilimonas sp. Q87]|uniref:Crp/Fnr family transcriptional regulator n=1 Tax=Gracilimonas sp. Q87 TaxID=3384766 RepID=UPI0039845B9A
MWEYEYSTKDLAGVFIQCLGSFHVSQLEYNFEINHTVMEFDKQFLSFLKPQLREEVIELSSVKEFSKGTEILREEQYVKVLPIVIEGLVKVYSRFNEKELLLYYIEPSQSCVMTFYAALKNTPSQVFAVTEEASKILLIPVKYLPGWLKDHPEFNELFYNQFNLRYTELLNTIGHLLVDNMDKRLYDHLKKKSLLTKDSTIRMSHSQIANELGTAREVVTRVLSKLKTEGKVVQNSIGIKIIEE